MSGDDLPRPAGGAPLRPEVLDGSDEAGLGGEKEAESSSEAIERPAKVLRIGAMVKQLLDEVRQAPLDEASRDRLRAIYDRSLSELKGALSPDLADELDRISVLFDSETPSEPELRVAQAQLDEMRQRSLPPAPETAVGRPGTYL